MNLGDIPGADMSEQRNLPVDMLMVERMTRVETKLDAVLDSKRSEHDDMRHVLSDHETRLRALEKVWWKTTGLAAGISAVITTVGAILVKLVFGV